VRSSQFRPKQPASQRARHRSARSVSSCSSTLPWLNDSNQAQDVSLTATAADLLLVLHASGRMSSGVRCLQAALATPKSLQAHKLAGSWKALYKARYHQRALLCATCLVLFLLLSCAIRLPVVQLIPISNLGAQQTELQCATCVGCIAGGASSSCCCLTSGGHHQSSTTLEETL